LFKWRHFLPEIILLNVRWYCRYSLSYRDLEEMMAERGVEVVSFGASRSEHIPLSIDGC
jgi:transposase-like protein